jgi:hypothetical protein
MSTAQWSARWGGRRGGRRNPRFPGAPRSGYPCVTAHGGGIHKAGTGRFPSHQARPGAVGSGVLTRSTPAGPWSTPGRHHCFSIRELFLLFISTYFSVARVVTAHADTSFPTVFPALSPISRRTAIAQRTLPIHSARTRRPRLLVPSDESGGSTSEACRCGRRGDVQGKSLTRRMLWGGGVAKVNGIKHCGCTAETRSSALFRSRA